MRKPRIGIVGTGKTVGIAHFHVQGLLADGRAEITGVYDIDQIAAANFLTAHGLDQTRIFERYDQLLDAVDAVLICTPNFTHIDYVIGAIQNETAVFVEKPLALSPSDSLRALRVLQEKPVFNMVGFVMRYPFVIQALRKFVLEDIGRVYTLQASHGGRRLANPDISVEWRMVRELSGSGALGDFGSHLVDLAFYTAGMSINKVCGMASTIIPVRKPGTQGLTHVENDDQAAFIGQTADDALASFTVSRVGMDDLRLLVVGEGGMARVNFGVPDTLEYLPAVKGVYDSQWKTINTLSQKPFDGWFDSQMQVLVDCLTGQEVDVPDIRQGHYVERVLEAAAISCSNNKDQIDL